MAGDQVGRAIDWPLADNPDRHPAGGAPSGADHDRGLLWFGAPVIRRPRRDRAVIGVPRAPSTAIHAWRTLTSGVSPKGQARTATLCAAGAPRRRSGARGPFAGALRFRPGHRDGPERRTCPRPWHRWEAGKQNGLGRVGRSKRSRRWTRVSATTSRGAKAASSGPARCSALRPPRTGGTSESRRTRGLWSRPCVRHPRSAGAFRACSARSFCKSASDFACEDPSMAFSAIS